MAVWVCYENVWKGVIGRVRRREWGESTMVDKPWMDKWRRDGWDVFGGSSRGWIWKCGVCEFLLTPSSVVHHSPLWSSETLTDTNSVKRLLSLPRDFLLDHSSTAVKKQLSTSATSSPSLNVQKVPLCATSRRRLVTEEHLRGLLETMRQ